ncbi:hypothetical protein [Companilactobacillus bobalius]|uniref:Uncharacterized protein n=2 Tax=Companilactobacillus bobalius TaxID=2801451 RepID=A0A202F5V2_9LACO|nr:hypothetical protein [Companilactobacillus bobalius]OVE95827.1 hypothetical protein LKACC16343_02579 [Companilactobacillus bobalius]GEO59319.1 hypothetical protein LBO01_24480 [Companilactobacillus paralimentarius]
MYSYQKMNPYLSYEMFSDKDLVDQLLTVVNRSGKSYETKEKALHLVNEMLFYELVNSNTRDTSHQEKSQKPFGF